MSASRAVHEADVRARINAIVDPCSTAMAEPIGIDDFGIVQHVRIDGGEVEVVLLPTSPHCLFLGLFEEEIEQRLRTLPGVTSVRVTLTDGAEVWDEQRIAPTARRRLQQRRRSARALTAQRD